jgi:hypothetical protein
MADAYYYNDAVARFQVLLEEVTRARPGSPESRFVVSDDAILGRLGSSFHHILFGRRGSGKSSLLRYVESRWIGKGHLVAWADQETFMGLSYPDVLVSTLETVFMQFSQQIRRSDPPLPKRRWWQRSKQVASKRQLIANRLDQAVAQLILLKNEPSEAEIEWTASYSARTASDEESGASLGLTQGPVSASASRKVSASTSRSAGADIVQKYKATKAEHLERAVSTYRDLIKQATTISSDAFVILDDFYRLTDQDQPKIAGYFHRVVKDTGVWLKLGSIRYWTHLYAGGSPATGMQVPHDIRELSLDRGLLDFRSSKRFLEQILDSLASEAGVDVELLFSEGARDRLVLAAGGVPRDYIGLTSEAIAVARNRGPSAKTGTERVIAEDVNEGAGRTVESKFNDLEEDAGTESVELRDLVVDITNHCRETRSACFLVDYRNQDLVRQMSRLQNMRFVHALDMNESLPDPQSSRYNVYLLDVSQLAAQRAWQVDFMGWTKREKRRARKLVFEPGRAPEPAPEPIQEQLAFDDVSAVVGDVDPPNESPV